MTKSLANAFSIVLLTLASHALADDTLLGVIDFPNSGSAEAQKDFIDGVLYLHNFEYQEASEAFQRAQEIDSDFALAYWGEAMTYHHSLWNRQSSDSAEKVLRRLGRNSEARAAKAPTQREKDLLRGAEIVFGIARETARLTKEQRDVAYRDHMQRMHETYPGDNDITALYGLSILGVGSVKREYTTYIRAAAVLTEVWDSNRQHPGAAHYLIHSYDDPVHAPLGLPMARAYAKIAPGAAHAQHMTSHIFSALGMWDDLVSANERALDIEYPEMNPVEAMSREASHYSYWLHYGYLAQGRIAAAEDLLKLGVARLNNNAISRERAYYGGMVARHYFDSMQGEVLQRWAVPEGVSIPSPHYHFARSYAALQAGDIERGIELMEYIHFHGEGNPEIVLNDDVLEVLERELQAVLALRKGSNDRAVTLAQEAIILNDALPFRYGPPQVTKPARELLGDILLELGRNEEAAAAFGDQLKSTPRRAPSLLGLARAAHASGQSALALRANRDLSEVWHGADSAVRDKLVVDGSTD